ncbi:MAG: serine/threonine-protein kinase [Planctomycetota bacterium]
MHRPACPIETHHPTPAHAEGDSTSAFAEGVVVLERFVLRRPLGSGMQGRVWAATDLVSDDEVAVKIVPRWSESDLAAASREIAALRLLALPGIVRLLDAGAHAGCGCVAMELVEGRPFPGTEEAVPWDELEPLLRELLETLSRVHAAGILHRDLKPANVLVNDAGSPTVLDLGVAGGTALAEDAPEVLAGTPRYMAPTLFAGAPPSVATDLYSVAVMAFEAVTGEPLRGPQCGLDELVEPPPAAPIERRLERVAPVPIARSLAAVLACGGTAAEDAEDLLDALDADACDRVEQLANEVRTLFGDVERLTAARLELLFRAEERIVGLRSAAARLLFEATAGRSDAIVPELARWLALGIGRVRLGRVELQDLDVERLERRRGMKSLREQRELQSEWRRAGLFGLARASFEAVEGRIESGDLRTSLGDLAAVLATLVQLRRYEEVEPVLQRWLRVALFANDRRALELLLHEIQKIGAATEAGTRVAAIAIAALSALDGAFDRARERLATVPGDMPFELALSWHAVDLFRARQAKEPTELARSIEATRHWVAETRRPVPELMGWDGWCAYHRGEYERAEQLHRECAVDFDGPRRAQCMLDAGSAALESGDFGAASECVAAARGALHGHRHPFASGRVEWLARAIEYRSKRALAVDEELVRLAELVGAPKVTGMVFLTEAAVAWRSDELFRARDLGRSAARALVCAGQRHLARLPDALARVAAGRDAGPAMPLAVERMPPALAIQCAELWLRGGGTLGPDTAASIRASWASVAPLDHDLRREVLALDECEMTRSMFA